MALVAFLDQRRGQVLADVDTYDDDDDDDDGIGDKSEWIVMMLHGGTCIMGNIPGQLRAIICCVTQIVLSSGSRSMTFAIAEEASLDDETSRKRFFPPDDGRPPGGLAAALSSQSPPPLPLASPFPIEKGMSPD